MRRLAIIFLAVAAGFGLLASSAGATAPPTTTPTTTPAPSSTTAANLAPVNVVQVSGLIDEILIDEINTAIRDASADGTQALILQVNSTGAVVNRDRMADVLTPGGHLFIGHSETLFRVSERFDSLGRTIYRKRP